MVMACQQHRHEFQHMNIIAAEASATLSRRLTMRGGGLPPRRHCGIARFFRADVDYQAPRMSGNVAAALHLWQDAHLTSRRGGVCRQSRRAVSDNRRRRRRMADAAIAASGAEVPMVFMYALRHWDKPTLLARKIPSACVAPPMRVGDGTSALPAACRAVDDEEAASRMPY